MSEHTSTISQSAKNQIESRIQVIDAVPRDFPGPRRCRYGIQEFIAVAMEANRKLYSRLQDTIEMSDRFFEAMMDKGDYNLDEIERLLLSFADGSLEASGYYESGEFSLREPSQLQLIDEFADRLRPSLRDRYDKVNSNDVEKIGILLQDAIAEVPFLRDQDAVYQTVLAYIMENGVAVEDIWLMYDGQIIIRQR